MDNTTEQSNLPKRHHKSSAVMVTFGILLLATVTGVAGWYLAKQTEQSVTPVNNNQAVTQETTTADEQTLPVQTYAELESKLVEKDPNYTTYQQAGEGDNPFTFSYLTRWGEATLESEDQFADADFGGKVQKIVFAKLPVEFIARPATWGTVPTDGPLSNALSYTVNEDGTLTVVSSSGESVIPAEDVIRAISNETGSYSSVLFKVRSSLGEETVNYALALQDGDNTYFGELGQESGLTIGDYEGYRTVVGTWVDR